ncbi:DUF4268 domain-containing protein [Christiangramia forsetii]|uniref:DUF4268 domain-containing protein n=2 Tax=Christiangramia forsetii TaxID=411153 RepID=A0M2L7_CHRFK|nr:DUF4268 domain-containing protein [Christiangramia forsetii]GGG38746.1 hypothetical protein GCM10011532_23190 [Christiangramia forsetii]CAL66862.1 hypothetical protein GFO_1892 [Christiangramia forsetii KT0803]
MFSKEESKQLRQEFWTSFGKEFPHKWLLYNTKMKEIQLKFTFDRKVAQVSLDIVDNDELIRSYYFEKLLSLKTVLTEGYLPEIVFAENYDLPEEKKISRIYVEMGNVSIYNKEDWPEVKKFLSSKMLRLEDFFNDFNDFLKN